MDTTAPHSNDAYRAFLQEIPKTSPGTLGGRMLRHYWHPVCLSKDLVDVPFPVRMLGENLVAFRGVDGAVGLIADRCAHRCASLQYGQIHPSGLKCSYHGWTYDARGKVVDMPLEPVNSRLKDEIRHPWYPVQEWPASSGATWARKSTTRRPCPR